MAWVRGMVPYGRRLLLQSCQLPSGVPGQALLPPRLHHTRMLSGEGERWLWPADRWTLIYDAFDRQNTRKGSFCILFNTRQPLNPHHLRQSLVHLQRRLPNLRTCLQPRGDILWFCQKTNPTINFQVSEDPSDLGHVCNQLMAKPFSNTDSVLWRAGLIHRGSLQSQAAFPHKYALVLCIHHGLADGLDHDYSLHHLMDILDDTMAGRTVDDTPLGFFTEKDDIQSLLQQVKQKLLEDPQQIDFIRRTLPTADKKPLLMQIAAKSCVSEPATGHVARTINPQMMNNFQQMAREEGVSFNSSMAAAINTAIVELAKEEGISQDSYTVTASHLVSLRLYLGKLSIHRTGMFPKALIHSSELSKDTRDIFWEYGMQLHQELKSGIKTGLPLQQYVVSTMDKPQLSPDDFVANFCPTLHDYYLSNMTTVTSVGNDQRENLRIEGMFSYFLVHNYISNFHQLCKFNDNYYYTISYDKQYLCEDTVNRLLDKTLDVMAAVS